MFIYFLILILIMSKAYSIEGDVIVLNRELNELDYFVRDFLDVLKKHSNYLVVSGYVSICTGRFRGTEDVDVLVLLPSLEQFSKLFEDLYSHSFWCLQNDNFEECYNDYLTKQINLRFARKDQTGPNIEFIPVTKIKKIQFFELVHPQKIRIKDFEFKVPPLEFEILYKEIKLGSEKDFEDALHLRTMFFDILKEENFKYFKKIITKDEINNKV